jgi:TonB family protein
MGPSGWKNWILVATAAMLFAEVLTFAQAGSTDVSKRKIKLQVAPAYPELARIRSVSGKVKIEVVITPDGHVKSTRVMGGHPLLVQACTDAVKGWKFTPASEETTQIVEFEFHGSGS